MKLGILVLIGTLMIAQVMAVDVGLYGEANSNTTIEGSNNYSNNYDDSSNNGNYVASGIIRVNSNVNLTTNLDVNLNGNGKIVVMHRNGENETMEVTPNEAIVKVTSELHTSCQEDCSVELKSNNREETELVYEVESEKRVTVLGFMKSDMNIEAEVDARTGQIVDVDRPWWAFTVTSEEDANVSAN